MSDSIASAEVKTLAGAATVILEEASRLSRIANDFDAAYRAQQSHTQALQGQVEELRGALKELIAYLDSMSDFDHQPEPLAKARSILAAHRGEMREDLAHKK